MSFAFVRFQEPDAAISAINKLNGAYMDGHRLKVASARARKLMKESSWNDRLVGGKDRHLKAKLKHTDLYPDSTVNKGQFLYDKVKIVRVSVNNVNMEWLGRSIVAERATHFIFSEVSERLLNVGKEYHRLDNGVHSWCSSPLSPKKLWPMVYLMRWNGYIPCSMR